MKQANSTTVVVTVSEVIIERRLSCTCRARRCDDEGRERM